MQPLNADTLATLGEFMNERDLGQFLDSVRQDLAHAWPALEASWQGRDWAAVQKAAHRLKGLVGTVGCDPLFQDLNRLEAGLRAQPACWPGDADLAGLRVHVDEASQALSAAAQARVSLPHRLR